MEVEQTKSSGQATAYEGRVAMVLSGTVMGIPFTEMVPPVRGPPPTPLFFKVMLNGHVSALSTGLECEIAHPVIAPTMEKPEGS